MVEVSIVQHVQNVRAIGLCIFTNHTLACQLYLSLSLSAVTCPTDSRKRPDQRLLEEGNVDAASSEKYRLEEKQRAARRLRQSRKEEWKPRCVCRGVGGCGGCVCVCVCGWVWGLGVGGCGCVWVWICVGSGWVGCACVLERWRMA